MKKTLSPYMHLNRVEFVVTERCNGRCRHCQVGDMLNPEGPATHVRTDKAAALVETLCRHEAITSVMTFGGEPMLYPEAVYAIHAAATACRVPARQLITNGYFTRDAARQREAAQRLKEAGVNSLLLSVDAFHQETIPVAPVHGFACAAAEVGIPGATLYPAWLHGPQADNPYDGRTREVLAAFADVGLPIATGNRVHLSGHATAHLAEYFDRPALDKAQRCGAMPYTDPLTAITSLTVMPNGDIRVCNFVIGNAYQEDITEIVARYNPHEDARMRAVMEGGIDGLLAYADSQGLSVDLTHCYSVCDVCHAVMACRG